MSYIFFICGVIIILLILYDVMVTTLTTKGGGVISSILARSVWKAFLIINKTTQAKYLINYIGSFLIVTVLVTWILGLWIGNSLIFNADTSSVVDSQTGKQTDAWGRIYFAGYALATLGNGDLKPNGAFWRIYTNLLSLSGLMLISISVTYFLPILEADNFQKKLSKRIAFLGNTPQEIIINGWNGKSFTLIKGEFMILADQILEHSERLDAYPILHYFQSSQTRESLILNLFKLDEAISIILNGTEKKQYTSKGYREILILRKAISTFIDSQLPYIFKKKKITVPPVPKLNLLAQKGQLKLRADKDILTSFQSLNKRRKTMHAVLSYNGWQWNDIYSKHK
jgi:hypothetical protein